PIPKVISRPHPSAVTYDLSRPHRVKITLPPGSKWSSGLHWHETHTEYLRLLSGTIRVRLGDEVRVLSASAPGGGDGDGDGVGVEVRVDRYVWHEWGRAGDGEEGEEGEEDVVVEERTEPEDGEKGLFFWNLNGVILRAQKWEMGRGWLTGWWLSRWLMGWWVEVNLFAIFWRLDNFPVFVDFAEGVRRWGWTVSEGSVVAQVLRWLDWCWTHLVLMLASWVGWVVGVRPVRPEFTPREEYERWVSRQ
ncbi:Cupin, RmlC-type, partial [Coniochaeta sp. PMI_546]